MSSEEKRVTTYNLGDRSVPDSPQLVAVKELP